MTLDLEPITEQPSKLDLEPVSGPPPSHLDLEPIEPLKPKSLTPASDIALAQTSVKAPTSPQDARLQSMGVDTAAPEDSYVQGQHLIAENAAQAGVELLGGMIPKSVDQYAKQLFPPLGAYDAFQHIRQGNLGDIPFVGRVPELIAADKTPDWSKERFLAAGKTLMDLGMLAGAGEAGKVGEIVEPIKTNATKEAAPTLQGETRQTSSPEASGAPPLTPQEAPVGLTDTLAELKRRNVVTPGEVAVSDAAPTLTTPESADVGAVPPISDQPIISEIANRYTQERSETGDLGTVQPGRGTSAQELATRGQKLVEGGADVDAAISRVMSGTFDPVNDASIVRFEEARLRIRKDQAYRDLQQNPQSPELQINYDNAFNDLTDFHKGPIAQVKGNWAEAGRGLQGQFPVDVSTADGIREAWLQATGEDAPPSVRPTMEKVADRVKRSVDAENGDRSRLYDSIEKDFSKTKQKSHEAIRDRFLKELEDRPCR